MQPSKRIDTLVRAREPSKVEPPTSGQSFPFGGEPPVTETLKVKKLISPEICQRPKKHEEKTLPGDRTFPKFTNIAASSTNS